MSFGRGHGPPPKKKAFISIYKHCFLIYYKSSMNLLLKIQRDSQKIKAPLISQARNDNSNLFLLYIPTCPHTHIQIYMILKNKFEIFTHDSTFSHVISYQSKTLHYSLPILSLYLLIYLTNLYSWPFRHFSVLATVFPQWLSLSKKNI